MKVVVVIIALVVWTNICVRAGYETGVADALKGTVRVR